MPIMLESSTVFEEVCNAVRVDESGRVDLGSDYSGQSFRVLRSESGELLLTPVIAIPEREMWLYRNPEALATLRQGLEEAHAGLTVGNVDFSQYADLEIEED